jgi:hypothetical protein
MGFWALTALLLLSQFGWAEDPRLGGLPKPIQALIHQEQVLIDMAGGDPKFLKPRVNLQKPEYRPESRPVITLKTYWVDETAFAALEGSGFPESLRATFRRTRNGKSQVRLLVHPETEGFYSPALALAERAKDFLATPTASSRTLVAWQPGAEHRPFFAKVSLDAVIGGVDRTIKNSEVAASLGVHEILASADLPRGAAVLPESFGLIAKGGERGGMILREIPDDILTGRRTYVPLFALYGSSGSEPPMLVKMIRESDDPDFMRNRVIRPFLEQWFDFALQGITMEAHGQNTLIGLGPDGLPDGSFLHRDFGGFNVDLDFRREMGLKLPENLPFVRSLQLDYYQLDHRANLGKSLGVYFSSSFLWAADKRIQEWKRAGLLPMEVPESSQQILLEEFAKVYREKTGLVCGMGGDFRQLLNCILKARENKLRGLRCGPAFSTLGAGM